MTAPSLGMPSPMPRFQAARRVAAQPVRMPAQDGMPKAGDVQFGMSRRGGLAAVAGGVLVALAALTGCTQSIGHTVPTGGGAPKDIILDDSTGQYTIGGKPAYPAPAGPVTNPCPEGFDQKKTFIVDHESVNVPAPQTFCMAPDSPQPSN